MTHATAEAAHELGREGTLRAKHLLWQVLGEAIDLPFNAYDHQPKLTFTDIAVTPNVQFSFDLGGILKRKSPGRWGGQEAVEVFVEVKAHTSGGDLLGEYRRFLRRAAIVTTEPRHKDSWFIFLAGSPFGTTIGQGLCNGILMKDCRDELPPALREASKDLHERVALLIATQSFERLLMKWGPNA